MDEPLSIELLESTHVFPCTYMFKVIGLTDHHFTARVVAAVRDELGSDFDPPYRTRETAGGRHVAVTLEPVVRDAYDVLAVYRRLREVLGVVIII